MAAEAETMFYVRETPWHGLGTKVMGRYLIRAGCISGSPGQKKTFPVRGSAADRIGKDYV